MALIISGNVESVFESFSPLMEKSEKGEGTWLTPWFLHVLSNCALGLKRSHTVSCSSIFGGGQGGPSYSPSGRRHFPPFRHPDGCPLKELVPEPQRCLENRPSPEMFFFEDEYPFILKAFTYLEVNAKATDDFQINISIP